MTIIVTGGAGFIGGNFVHYHLKEHQEDRGWREEIISGEYQKYYEEMYGDR